MARDDICDWIAAHAVHMGDRPFLTDDQGKVITYGALASDVARMGQVLIDMGVQPGDRVTAQVEKSPEALMLYLACLWVGAIYMPLNTGYTASEIDYFVGDAEPVLMVTEPGVIVPDGVRTITLTQLCAAMTSTLAPRHTAAPDDLAAMCYTSGTTGRPKGAMISRRALASNAQTLAAAWRFTAQDVLIHALPVYHVHGLFVATNTVLASGASMLFQAKFDATHVLSALSEATVLMGVPTFYTRLLSLGALDRAACQSMRLFVSGSAPLLAETHRDFAARTGHAIIERYGMTETQINTSNPYDGARVPGTVGLPLPGISVRVVDPDRGTALPMGDIGMIEVKGPNLFAGYWRNPEKTAADMRDDGFFITGDLGRIDEHGYVHIVGRGKDLIISGGLNVYPKEVETEINALPGVIESAVIGVPHADFGEAVVAILVSEAPINQDQMLEALSGRLAKFKLPKAIIAVDALPRNTMGKVQKTVLRDLYAEVLSTG